MVKVTLEQLLHQCDDALGKMSAKNPHRQLIAHCAQVLILQAQAMVQQQAQSAPSQVVLTDA